jgi:putative MFS transporter
MIRRPTGLLFILRYRWIPESPRFLLANGRDGEADSVMQRFGAVVVARGGPDLDVESGVQSRWSQLLSGELLWLTVIVGVLALGSGLVLFGFNLWIPSNLRKLGFHDADAILRNAALIGFPLNLLVAWMYGFWSSKKTIIALSALTAAALLGFVVAGNAIVQNRALLYALLVVPIWGISSVVAVLSVYAAEVYPTRVRSRGSGFAAGASKAGGVAIIGLVAFGIAAPSISTVALIGAVPMALAVVLVAFFGVETRQRRLEEITAEELKVAYYRPSSFRASAASRGIAIVPVERPLARAPRDSSTSGLRPPLGTTHRSPATHRYTNTPTHASSECPPPTTIASA